MILFSRILKMFFIVLAPQGVDASGFLDHLNGEHLTILSGLPFAGLLLSIALAPLLIPAIWHRIENMMLIFWATCAMGFMYKSFGLRDTGKAAFATLTSEYIPFILIIAALYVVSSSIKIYLHGVPTPWRNVKFMFWGSLLASVIGTTGAAMLLIRPLLQFNHNRHHKVHIVIFFIFLVANIGGCLTPLGDPPLFLGLLYGVHFFWPLQYLVLPFMLVFVFMLGTFWMIDHQFYDLQFKDVEKSNDKIQIDIQGKAHFIFIPLIISLVLLSSKTMGEVTLFDHTLSIASLLRDSGFIVVIGLNLFMERFTHQSRPHHHWGPIREVMRVFLSIFITMIPISLMLKAGNNGAFSGILDIANNGDTPNPLIYFWLTGFFSSFLDNAPTYALFYKMAGGSAQILMTNLRLTLEAISLGAVFFGAITYIGNAPNFMVRSIAKQSGVEMPSFLGYMAWSLAILVPIYLGVSLLWFL